MGTAGPLALARHLLDDGSGKPFFVLNRCVWAEVSLTQLHEEGSCLVGNGLPDVTSTQQ
jgi:hypothetical protein